MYYESPIHITEIIENTRKISDKYHFMGDLDGLFIAKFDNKVSMKFDINRVSFVEAHSKGVDIYFDNSHRISFTDSGMSYNEDFGEYFPDDHTEYYDGGDSEE